MGGGGSVLVDIWGVTADGKLQKLGFGAEVGGDYWLYDDLDPHIAAAFANACYAGPRAEAKEQLIAGLSLLSVGNLWNQDKEARPLMVEVKSKSDFPKGLPSKVQECLGENTGRLTQCVELSGGSAESHEVIRTRCFLYTNTRPRWSWTDLVCFGFLYRESGDLLYSEILLHDKCSDFGRRSFMDEIGR